MSTLSHSRSTKRTPYTPVFYPPSGPSSAKTATQAEVPEAYLDYLSRQHIALAQIVQETPSSRCGSPIGNEEAQARVDALRERVREAFKHANGDPADGKWGPIVQLLRLSSTQRFRWLGATADGEMAESKYGWINAQSEEEWKEWEDKRRQDDQLKQRIQNWQQDVDATDPEQPASTLRSRRSVAKTLQGKSLPKNLAKTSQSSLAPKGASLRDPKDPSALGFPVVKRSSAALTKKAQFSGEFPKTIIEPSKTPSASSERIAPGLDAPAVVGSSATKPQLQTIQDISETSFLPPSFPEQLAVSTPNTKTHQRHKPEPIARESLSHPDPYLISEPMSGSASAHNVEKRARSHTPPLAIKKARIEFPAINSDTSLLPNSIAPPEDNSASSSIMITPKHAQLPKLTDLLASRKRKPSLEQKSGTPVERSKAPHLLQIKPMSSSGTPLEPATMVQLQKPKPDRREVPDLTVPVFPSDGPVSRALDHMGDLDSRLDQVTPLYDMASPTKSLSSLAASDSDDEEYDGDDGFDPPLTSTQAQGTAASGKARNDFGWTGGYNSQLDIDGKVDMVSKFIEQDLDFGGWLKDPSEGSDGVGS